MPQVVLRCQVAICGRMYAKVVDKNITLPRVTSCAERLIKIEGAPDLLDGVNQIACIDTDGSHMEWLQDYLRLAPTFCAR